MGFELAVADDGGGLTGVDLRRHRGAHLLLGKGACRRLAKILSELVRDNGTAAEVPFVLAEWLASVHWSHYKPCNKGIACKESL